MELVIAGEMDTNDNVKIYNAFGKSDNVGVVLIVVIDMESINDIVVSCDYKVYVTEINDYESD